MKNLRKKLLAGLFITTMAIATPCIAQGDNRNVGEVPVISESISFYNREDRMGCGEYVTGSKLGEKEEVVIHSQEEYQNMLDEYEAFYTCEWGKEAPKIDFSQKTLLGKYAQGVGCSIDFKRNVHRDDTNKKIIYSIDVLQEGRCDMLGESMNWVLIPKIPSDYEAEFKVKKIRK
ncbi:MAG: hypothetical protein KKA79_01100 [Nanoarchaeota archaeon]|nr:hypothetical protein [Nanoarchaeota archaeon]